MTDKYIFYEFDGERYKVPAEKQQDFESKAPNAKIMLTFDGENYKVPLTELNSFVSKAGGANNLTYSAFDDKKQYSPNASTEKLFSFGQPKPNIENTASAPVQTISKAEAPELEKQPLQEAASEVQNTTDKNKVDDDKVTWWDTLTKGTGGMLAGVGSRILDAAIQSTSGTMMNPRTGEYFQGVDYEDRINDMSDPIVRARHKASDAHERLSLAADPTGGQVGFSDLIKEGKFGMAMQKGLATTIESAPMMLASASPYTMALNAMLMASENYANETLENPEIEGWKRMTYSVGSAALEQAVEKFADPIFKYIGGGKVAKEFTEEAAKELLEKISKESVDNIGKRILKRIGKVGKNLGKDMAGEGTEELITSFGNDALGSALDAIEGNEDYGINAQWEEYKKQNPNATKEDFAKSKGKEYLDAFIGGALSSVYMSGTAQAVNEVAAPIRENNAKNNMQALRNEGAKMGYADIYDIDSDVAEASSMVSESFKDKDGNPTLGDEFISMLTAEDAMMLSNRADLSSEQRTALSKLAGTKAVQEGLTGKLDDALETEINANKALMEHVTENGKIISGQLRGRLVYIMGGAVNNGKVTIYSGHEGPVIAYDALTGEAETIGSKYITDAVSNNANDVISFMEESYRGADAKRREIYRNTMSPRAKFRAIQPYAGKKILVDVGNGITDVLVQEISPNGDVLIKGKKGDLGGNAILKLNAATFYDSIYRDDAGNPVITDAGQETEETVGNEPTEGTTTTEGTGIELTGEEDFRGYEGQIFINGALVDVTDAQQDNPSNTVNYTYVDETGNVRVGSTTISEFAEAVQQANAQNVEPAPAPEPASEETTEETDWDALFEKDTVAFYDEVKRQFGDKAMDFLSMEIAAVQNEINSLEKNMGKSTNERAKNFSKLASLRLKLGSLNEMVELLERQSATEPATEPVTTEPAAETPVEPTEEPAPVEPIQTENGFIIVDKVITNPEVIEMPNTPEGDANRIFIGEYNGKWTYGAEALMDNGSWGKTPEMRIENARYDTREDAIKGAISFLENQWRDKRKDAGSTALDAFLEHVRNNYLSNTSDSQGNSVPLETEPTTGNDEGQGAVQQTGGAEGYGADTDSGRADDGGSPESGSGDSQATSTRKGEGEGGDTGSQVDKYPARKGNATKKLLVDTFGLEKVTIPDSRKSILNSIYDFMMEMSKVLGISPKSIGQGGWLRVDNLRQNANASARHELRYIGMDTIESAHMKFKYGWLTGIAHEWWHALDHALSYFETGKGIYEASSVSDKRFTGRKETLEAVRDVIRAIEKSGHPDRIRGFIRDRKSLDYYLSPTEMAARAFEEYINTKFVENNIIIDGVRDISASTQPTIEEMDVIAPAFDKLFKVLKEKKGKEAGTSILYHIAQDLKQNDEVKQQMGALVADWIQKGGNFVVMDSAAMEQAIIDNGLLQEAKRLRRTIVNSDLTNEEKKKIKEYILSLPKDISADRPYMVKFDGYAYIFNASRRFFEENTTKKPKGDGFEVLHKRELALLSELETRLLDATYGEDRGDISEMLQILGIDKGRSSNSSSVTADAGTEGNNGRLDEAEHREGTSADGGNLGGLRNTGDVQKLETPDGTIFGFVKDGVVYLDPTLLNPNTSIHEYTHLWDNALMQLNPALWEKGKALMKKTSIWKEVISDPNYADIKDNEDLVASEVHSRIVGTKGAERLNQLEQEARAKGLTKGAKELSILGRLREWINEATQWLKDAFTAWSKEELDAVTLSDFINMPLRDLANFKTLPKTEPQQVTNENGELVANDNGKGKIQFSISTWRDGGRDYLVNWLKKDKTLTRQEKEDILARMDEFYENAVKYTDVYTPFGTWSEAAVKYDENGNPLMSVIKKNGDYSMNLDFSLVCKKRRPLNKLLRTLINRNAFGTYSLRERELAEINWILQEHGFEVACALCFVDSKRYRVTGVADVFAELYNKFVKALAPEGAQIAHFNYSNNPNIESVENGLDTLSDEQLNWDKFNELANQYEPTTVEGKVAKFLRENPSQRRLVDATDFIDAVGFEAVKEGNPALLSLYNSKKGTGGPKASFGDVQYLNDILKKSRSFTAGRAYDVGGVRLQSFSDFVPHMYFDYMQLFAELTAKKLPAHAYTKEVLFAKIFGLTGLKINMSLVPAVVEGGIAPGLDANGNYAWADAVKDKDGNIIQQAQSFPFDEAMAIQNAEGYSKNCGVIAVGISDEHIEKMLNDPNIPFIIPYHKSSLNAIVARMTNIDQYKDYTNVQNTKKADGTKLDEGAKDFNFNAWLRKNKGATPKDAAQAYLDWCKKNNYRPKFSQFAYHPNYYKLLVDFNTVDSRTGEYTPQGAVTMTFPTGDNAFGDVETLIQQGLQEDAELEEKMDSEIEEVANEVEQRLAEIKNEPEMSEKEYAQKMAELADQRTARIKERAEEGDGILSRSGDITPEMDAAYMEAVERGDMETAQRMVDEAARAAGYDSPKLYHGTRNFGFTKIDTSKSDDGISFFTTESTSVAQTYSGVGGNRQISEKMEEADRKKLAEPYEEEAQEYILEHTRELAEWLNIEGRGIDIDEFATRVTDLLYEVEEWAIQENKNGLDVLIRTIEVYDTILDEYYDKEKYTSAEAQISADDGTWDARLQVGKAIGKYVNVMNGEGSFGNYSFYANTWAMEEVDCKGANWNNIKSPDLPHSSTPWTTREVARHMKKEGWMGVILRNVVDLGGKASIPEAEWKSNIYIFFRPEAQVKSADPVTYDDNGNVIPLSDRFNPEKNDIRYRRSTPVEFHQLEVDNFLSKYNPNCEVRVFPVNERTAKMFGYTLEELKEKHGRYLPSYDFIAIFAREDIMDRSDIEDTLFHESIHKLAQSSGYEYMVEAGKWMWENASNNEVLSDYKEIIEEGYKNKSLSRKYEEMLCHVLAGAMESGHVEWLLQNVSEDTASILNEILNEIGYESAAETRERRARESVSQSAVAENLSNTESENAGQSSRRGQAGAIGRPENTESERRVTVENQNAAVNLHTGETRDGIIERAVSEEAQKLGVNVTFAKRSEMAKGHETDKGYYNTKTGEIVICPENNASIADAIQTILHEAVAHKGLRALMGDKFNEFINRVYDSLDAETKAKVDTLAESKYNGNTAVAMEEYMASLAETMDFENNSVWDKIKSIFNDIINAILGRNDIKIGDNELRYILRASYNNMSNPRNMETIQGWAQDQTMREEYGINEASPELLSRTGVTPDDVARETARGTYDRVVNDNWQEFQRQFQDAMQPVRIAIEAIQQETGNIPIEDYENYILMQNQASSRSRVEIDDFARRYYSPIIEKVEEIIDKIIEARGGDIKNKKQRMYAYQELKNYLISKHGLERNAYYQSHNTRKLTVYEKAKENEKAQKAFDEKVAAIEADDSLNDTEKELAIRNAEAELNADLIDIQERLVPDLRDYSGLTSLFGFKPKQYKKAEEEAQRLVENMEAEIGEEGVNELWKRINSATKKTLKHSYESGLLSRQQFNDINGMFDFYIPLRGFDETTAEDVYAYARFEGNKFNPAVQTAKGRTSVADDPIAIIMNMAESEIAQGNKNRAKQALYNFLLNRSEGNSSQNSLMQIESVWYYVTTDDSGKTVYTIAAPDHEAGETYEEFEARMTALEEEEKAIKSKKGKVNIGMRFQKQMNRNAHYVYLKVNGVEKAIYINGDPKAADAINGAYHKKSTYAEDMMRTINRFVSSTFTNYSLEFTARNYFRDMLYSHLNVGIKESDPAYRKKFRQNWRHNNIGTMLRMLTAYRAGEYDGVALTEDQAAFVEFMKNGGQTGYTVINSVENHKRELESAIKRMQKGLEKGGVKDSAIFKYTLGMVELLNEASELVSRFAAFKTSRDMGRGINTAINDAKEITVNFNTKGAQDGTGFMGAVARYFGWSKFFFNASVQGVQQIKAMANANKLKFGTVVGGIAATGFMMPVITAAISEIFSGDDDDDENSYWNIPEYERQNNLCIKAGDKYLKIPLPIGFREVYAIGDMVAAMAFDKGFSRDVARVGTDIANKISSILLPINPLESQANGLSLWHTGLYTALPSTLQFAIQNVSNVDWKGAPLQKEYTYNENDPQWMKAYASNPDWLKGLSKWCNEHINLDGDFEGVDWSPEKVDNTLSNLFGGIYTLIKKSGKSISMIWNEENRNLYNIPLAGVILGSGADSDDRFVTDAYYDMKEYYDKNIGKIKRTAKAFGYSLEDVFENEEKPGAHQPKMQKIYSNSNFDFMQEWYTGDKALESLRGKIDRREKKAAKMENPPVELIEEIASKKSQYEIELRTFVNDMLELD